MSASPAEGAEPAAAAQAGSARAPAEPAAGAPRNAPRLRRIDLPLRERTIGALLARLARTRPEHPCLLFEGRRYTFAEVDRLMRLISAGDTLPEPRVTQIDPDLVIRESTRGQR